MASPLKMRRLGAAAFVLFALLSSGFVSGQQSGAANSGAGSSMPGPGPVFQPTVPTITNTDEAEKGAPPTRPTIRNRGVPGVLDAARDAKPLAAPLPPAGADPNEHNEFQDFVASSLGRPLPLFGYNLFSGAPSTFAPVDRVPVTPDYVIGPGDEIVIRAWGQVDIDYRVVVDRNGAIHIPQIGTLTVGGLRYQDLQGFMRNAIGRVFRNFDLSVMLGQLRSVQVFVVGQAKRPGAYTVSSLSTLVNALFASGGPSTKGSMRRIQLKRGDTVVSEFDVYDLLLKGDKSKDARLLPGDVIYIPPIGDLVAIAGSVNQPAIFELKNGTTIGDLIELAGGLSTVAAGQKIKVERILERRTRRVGEFDMDQATLARPLQNGDVVQIYALSPRFENAITLRGTVANPGRYPWRDGLRVRDVIPDQESLLVPDYWQRLNREGRGTFSYSRSDAAHPHAPASRRFDPQRLEERPTDLRPRVEPARLFEEINWDYAVIERLNPTDLTTLVIPFNLGRAVLDGDPSQNLLLRPGDTITVFSRVDVPPPVAKQTQFVRLEGEVRTPGVYQVQPGETLRQLVTRVGGFTPSAYLYGAEFTRESVRAQQQKRLDEATDRLSREVETAASGRAQAAINEKENVQAQVDAQRKLIERLRLIKATGRVVLEASPDRNDLRDLPEMVLEDGDKFFVPARPSTIAVIGAVYNQTAYVHDPGKRTADYLDLAGGYTRGADKGRVYIVRADGTVTGRAAGSLFHPFPSEALNPGDTIVVPENIERFFFTKEIRDWTQIISQFALGVAAVKVLRGF